MVWCGVVWCGVVRCGVVWCGVVWCGVVWCGVVAGLAPDSQCYSIAISTCESDGQAGFPKVGLCILEKSDINTRVYICNIYIYICIKD